jgi:alpha-beta hydrolase superfamily lysophospholipase
MRKEYFFHAPDGEALFAREWIPEPADQTRAAVILVHGIGEHSGRYAHIASHFGEHHIALLGFDLRGHGLSHGARGDTPAYARLYDDLAMRIRQAHVDWPDKKIILYGHSLGGNIVINYVMRRLSAPSDLQRIDGVIASAPEFRLGFKPPAWKLAMARLLAVAAPGLSLASGLDAHALSHDPAIIASYQSDSLVHDRVTSRLFLGFSQAGDWALRHPNQWPSFGGRPLPLLLSYGTADLLVSPNAIHAFAESLHSSNLVEKPWDNFFHEVHNEQEHLQVTAFYIQWIEEQILAKE